MTFSCHFRIQMLNFSKAMIFHELRRIDTYQNRYMVEIIWPILYGKNTLVTIFSLFSGIDRRLITFIVVLLEFLVLQLMLFGYIVWLNKNTIFEYSQGWKFLYGADRFHRFKCKNCSKYRQRHLVSKMKFKIFFD